MLMLRKKKLKIARMLATLLYTGETDLDIPYGAFENISRTTVDIAYEVGGLSMVSCVADCLDEMRKGGEE